MLLLVSGVEYELIAMFQQHTMGTIHCLWISPKFSSSSTPQLASFPLSIWSASCVIQQHHRNLSDNEN
jgi:hypothetical protein